MVVDGRRGKEDYQLKKSRNEKRGKGRKSEIRVNGERGGG